MKSKRLTEEQVRVCPDSKNASKDYWLAKSEAKVQFEAGKLAIDHTNSTPERPVYVPIKAFVDRRIAMPQPDVANELQKKLEAAKQFVTEHLSECCREVIASHTSGIIGSGRVREAAALYALVNTRGSLKMALDEVANQAMAVVADEKPKALWKRTCQECGRWQLGAEPPAPLTDAFRNKKCTYCKSEALDYGSGEWAVVRGRLVRTQ